MDWTAGSLSHSSRKKNVTLQPEKEAGRVNMYNYTKEMLRIRNLSLFIPQHSVYMTSLFIVCNL